MKKINELEDIAIEKIPNETESEKLQEKKNTQQNSNDPEKIQVMKENTERA